jgi:hypothetical protein
VRLLFPSARGLKLKWHSIVKIAQSLYREAPGMDLFRPDQATPIPNFFLAGSYTKQVRARCLHAAPVSFLVWVEELVDDGFRALGARERRGRRQRGRHLNLPRCEHQQTAATDFETDCVSDLPPVHAVLPQQHPQSPPLPMKLLVKPTLSKPLKPLYP